MPISGSPWTAISRLAPKQSCWPCVSCGFRRPSRFAANCGSAVSVLLHTSSRVMVHDCTIDVADRISNPEHPCNWLRGTAASIPLTLGIHPPIRNLQPAHVWPSHLRRGRMVVHFYYGSRSRPALTALGRSTIPLERIAARQSSVVSTDVGFRRAHWSSNCRRPFGLSLLNCVTGSAVLCLRHLLLSYQPKFAPNTASEDACHHPFRLRIRSSRFCPHSEHFVKWQTLLAPNPATGRLDLWSLREPQSLCGSDGDARTYPASVLPHPLRARSPKNHGRRFSGAHGEHNLPLRIARRHGGILCSDGNPGITVNCQAHPSQNHDRPCPVLDDCCRPPRLGRRCRTDSSPRDC